MYSYLTTVFHTIYSSKSSSCLECVAFGVCIAVVEMEKTLHSLRTRCGLWVRISALKHVSICDRTAATYTKVLVSLYVSGCSGISRVFHRRGTTLRYQTTSQQTRRRRRLFAPATIGGLPINGGKSSTRWRDPASTRFMPLR